VVATVCMGPFSADAVPAAAGLWGRIIRCTRAHAMFNGNGYALALCCSARAASHALLAAAAVAATRTLHAAGYGGCTLRTLSRSGRSALRVQYRADAANRYTRSCAVAVHLAD
jgi:hypothetical protein